jgi:TorA maturation chaperone TorD
MTQSSKDMPRKKKMDRQKFSEMAHQRSNVYGLLSSIYSHEPDENFIRNFETSSSLPFGRGKMNGDKEFWAQSTEKICEDLAVEYTRLFLGPKNHIPPFESLYNFKKGDVRQIWGTATVEVKKIIESTGLSFRKDYEGIPDHISIELEFMQKLVKNEGELWEKEKNGSQLLKSIKLEKKFIDEHLQVWIPGFCQKVIEAARFDFYRNVAELTKDFIVTEKEEVENLLSFLTE